MVGRSPTWPCFVGTSMSVRGSDHPPYDCERKIELPIPSYDRRRPGPDVRGSVGGVYSGGGPPPQVPRAPGQPLSASMAALVRSSTGLSTQSILSCSFLPQPGPDLGVPETPRAGGWFDEVLP